MPDRPTDGAGADGAPPAVALCAACRRLGGCRLGITREILEPDGMTSTHVVCPAESGDGPQVASGAWIAGLFDEMLGHVPRLHGTPGVTAKLLVTYVHPVPVGRPLLGRAWIERTEARRWQVAGNLTLAGTGAVLARGSALMVRPSADHFSRHRAWLAEQDALADETISADRTTRANRAIHVNRTTNADGGSSAGVSDDGPGGLRADSSAAGRGVR